ncbi:MAG: DNA polymerase III subunit alpha [Chloroflexota bacterium]|nr:DNA polymerase III subunit alpha [Chloroflexota bacterium]
MSFVHLHCHSAYSFLDGASTPEELVDAAAEQGMDALALTDTDGLYGAVRFWGAAKERGIKPIFGCELVLHDLGSGQRLVLLAKDRQGWTSLCRIVSAAQLAGEKTKPRATFEMVERDAAGLLALVETEDPVTLAQLAGVFGESLYLELVDRWGPDDEARCDRRDALASEHGIATVITNDVRYARPNGRRLHDVMRCIGLGMTLDQAGELLARDGERWLKTEAVLRERLRRFPHAFANTRRIADACDVDLDFGFQRLPGFPAPEGHTAFSFLYSLCQDGARAKYGRITPAVSKQLAHELDVIHTCGLAEFFLINWDIVRFCRERRIPAQGRGSAADSIVAYVLDITKVDPIAHDLLFERFLTEDSRTMPDIDLDIATNDREEVIQYVYRTYGERYAAMVCNVVTYRARSASREVAKALGFRADTIDRLARAIDHVAVDPRGGAGGGRGPVGRAVRAGEAGEGVEAIGHQDRDEARPNGRTPLSPEDELIHMLDERERERLPLFRELTQAIADLPRHLSIHNGGMLITALPLVDTVPIERATMPGRNVVQFDKRDVEDLGLVKMDLLGLRTLSLIKDAVAMIDTEHGERLDLGTLPLDDPAVYDLICEVDTIGVFQVESRAQAQSLPRVRPRTFADIVVQVAIIRPGPLQGNMVNPYIRRRQGREPVTYAHPSLEPALRETLGVILFQEQILKVAMAVAGFSPAAADKLRRAMSRARSSEDMERLRAPFVEGAEHSGVDGVIAHEIFRQIAAFAEFGFCKSHAAAFALTAYHTCHLKLYYPAEFTVALLNNQPMGFYSPAVIAGDAKRHGIRVLPVDVNVSFAKAVVEERGRVLGAGVSASLGRSPASTMAAGPSGPTLRSVDTPAPHDRVPVMSYVADESDRGRAPGRDEMRDLSQTIARHRACRTHDVRLGLASVKALGDAAAEAVIAERERAGPFRSFDDFAKRVGIKEEALRNLALVGAFDSLGESRRSLLWRARDAHRTSPALARPSLAFPSPDAPPLPELSEAELTALDYRITGIPTGPQVMRFYREQLAARGVVTSLGLAALRHGQPVTVAGAIVVKQHPGTAKGHVFLSLEDEVGISNIIIRPATYRTFKSTLDEHAAVVVEGTLQHVDGVLSVLARRLEALELFVPIAVREWH